MSTLAVIETITFTVAGSAGTRPRIFTWPLARLFMADFGAMASFYLLLSAVRSR